jgi:hypothetical protein
MRDIAAMIDFGHVSQRCPTCPSRK